MSGYHGHRPAFAPDAAPHCARWTLACLPCNATWIGVAASHRCDHAQDYRRVYWRRRIRFGRPDATSAALEALVDRPIARALLVELLGPAWAVEADPR